jgi:hypothetical protein
MEHQSREQRTLHSKEQFLAKFFEAARVALMERPAKPAAHRVAGLRAVNGIKSAGIGIAVVKRKFFNNNHLNARGGLEPHFRVLFSAIFQGVSLGISIRAENYGIERKQNCSQL